jgi:hypothetical protein
MAKKKICDGKMKKRKRKEILIRRQTNSTRRGTAARLHPSFPLLYFFLLSLCC